MQNKDFRQAINLPLTVMLMQRRQMVKMEQTVSCVTRLHSSNFVQVGDKNFGDIVNLKNCQLR